MSASTLPTLVALDMPPEVFADVWGLVESVLAPDDFRQLGSRFGIASLARPPWTRAATTVAARVRDNRGATVADKSPKKDNAKKAGKTLKEKRAEKHMKKQGGRPIGT